MGLDRIQLPDNSSAGELYDHETRACHDSFQKGVAGLAPKRQDFVVSTTCSVRSGLAVRNSQDHQGQGQRCCGIMPQGIPALE